MIKLKALLVIALALLAQSVCAGETVTCTRDGNEYAIEPLGDSVTINVSEFLKADAGHVVLQGQKQTVAFGLLTTQLRVRKDGSGIYRLIMGNKWLPGKTMYKCDMTSTQIRKLI